MKETIEEIEGSQMGVALTADNGASPCYLTELSDDISDISTLVCNYSKKPTRSRKTRERMVNSLIGMLTDANNQLPIYIEDLKQAKCIEPFEVSSKQGDDDKHFLFWFFIEKLCEEVRDEDTYPILKRLITQFNSLLAEAEIAKLSCDPVVFKEFFFRKKKDYYDENVVIRFYRKLHRNQPITLGKLKKMELEAVIKALNQGIFDFADTPSMQDVNKVSTELETDFLPCNFMLTDEFLTRYAKFRQFAEKRGQMLVFNYERYGQYVVDNFNQLKDQILAIYELDVKLYLIHKEMVKLNKELENVLNGKVNGKAVSYLQESGEEMFHFIHPSLDDEEGWKIHKEVKRLVRRQSVPDICQYLGKLASEDKILLPLMPSAAYTELVRMGMSDGEGYGEKYFKKHYHLLFV